MSCRDAIRRVYRSEFQRQVVGRREQVESRRLDVRMRNHPVVIWLTENHLSHLDVIHLVGIRSTRPVVHFR